MSMQNWWNDTDRGKPKFLKKKCSQYQSFNHKSYMERPKTYRLSHDRAISTDDRFYVCPGSDWT
jgi:hypothetical protein